MRHRLVQHSADFHNRQRRSRRHDRTKVHLGVPKREIAVAISRIGAHQRHVARHSVLEHKIAAVKAANLFPFRQLRAEADRREERRNARSAGADALGKGALRDAFELDLSFRPEPLESRWLLAVASGGRAHHLAHEPGLDQLMRAGVAVRGGVHDQREIFRTAITKRTNEDVRKAGAAKARYEDRRPIGNISQRLGGTRDTLVDRHCDSVLPRSTQHHFARRVQAERAPLSHSAFMPANPITLPHFSVSSAMSLLNAAGERVISTQPRSSNFAFMAGSAKTALISRLSFSTMDTGVSLGAPTPYQALASKFCTNSLMVGRSGSASRRSEVVTARPRTRPDLMCSIETGVVEK